MGEIKGWIRSWYLGFGNLGKEVFIVLGLFILMCFLLFIFDGIILRGIKWFCWNVLFKGFFFVDNFVGFKIES